MFVSISCELANDDHILAIQLLMKEYGFTEVVRNLFESAKLKEEVLSRLKRDIDRRTDSFDIIRIYQYPLEDTLVITTLRDKHWKRTVVKKR